MSFTYCQVDILSSKVLETSDKNSGELIRSSQFGQLFEADKNRLYAYIYAFVYDPAMADDIFQETCLTLWQEFDKFELGTNFSKWANVIAYNRIRRHRESQKKYQLGLSDDFLQEFSENIENYESVAINHELKWRHLEDCCRHLSDPLKQIYQHFYVKNLTAQQIATNTGRSIHAIRKSVYKLRNRLFDCVEEKLQRVSK